MRAGEAADVDVEPRMAHAQSEVERREGALLPGPLAVGADLRGGCKTQPVGRYGKGQRIVIQLLGAWCELEVCRCHVRPLQSRDRIRKWMRKRSASTSKRTSIAPGSIPTGSVMLCCKWPSSSR